jgi:phosphate transport system substrate-binding protein
MKRFAFQSTSMFCIAVAVAMLMGVVMWGCQKPRKQKGGPNGDSLQTRTETATTGEINMGVDITMQPVLHQIVDAFHRDYQQAKINASYATEGELVKSLLADSMRLIFISRELTRGEAAVLKKDQYYPTVTVIARDAVVAILHPDNLMDSITMAQLGRLMRGEARTWADIGGSAPDTVRLVFDEPQSSTVRMIRDKFLGKDQTLPRNAFQATSQEKVVEYVSQDKHAIGFIGYCHVADRDEEDVQTTLSQVKLARLDAVDTSDVPGYFIRPYQNEIALGRYPLSRPVMAVSREHFNGLGTGFVTFAAGEIGQRILLKAGLVPEYMPPRFIVLPEKED